MHKEWLWKITAGCTDGGADESRDQGPWYYTRPVADIYVPNDLHCISVNPHGNAIRHCIGNGIAEGDAPARGPVFALARSPIQRVRHSSCRVDQIGSDHHLVD